MVTSVLTVKVDWAVDGSFATAGDDITSEVREVVWNRGVGRVFQGGSAGGGATIIVNNPSHKYDVDNAGSSLAGKLLPGRPVWITATYSSVTYPIFGGYLDEIVPLPGMARTAQLICVDAFDRYRRSDVSVAPLTSRSIKDFRGAILDALGETAGRRALDEEMDIVPLSYADATDALAVLEDLNLASGSRHFIRPGSTDANWYQYVSRNRNAKLVAAADESIADDSHGMSGYKMTPENVINHQRADGSPVYLPLPTVTVWTHPDLPISIKAGTSRTVLAEFPDLVVGAAVSSTTTGSPTIDLTSYGRTAKLVITAGGSDAIIKALTVVGRLASVPDVVKAVSEDSASRTTYGRRTGGSISSAYLASTALAQGVADHLVWRFKDPKRRPDLMRRNRFPSILAREIGDTIAYTEATLSVSARRFEITSLEGYCRNDMADWGVTYQLMELPAQQNFFTIGGTADQGVGGTAILAY